MYGPLATLFFLASAALGAPESGISQLPSTVPSILSCAKQTPTYSCENTTVIENTCCSPTPGGLVLQTQFWSTYTGLEKKGQKLPAGSWTIHGLWPDNCDGYVALVPYVASVMADSIYNTVDLTSSTAISRDNMIPLHLLLRCQTAQKFRLG